MKRIKGKSATFVVVDKSTEGGVVATTVTTRDDPREFPDKIIMRWHWHWTVDPKQAKRGKRLVQSLTASYEAWQEKQRRMMNFFNGVDRVCTELCKAMGLGNTDAEVIEMHRPWYNGDRPKFQRAPKLMWMCRMYMKHAIEDAEARKRRFSHWQPYGDEGEG